MHKRMIVLAVLLAAFAMNLTAYAATTPTLTVGGYGPSIYGASVTFTATISTGPTGTLTFYDGGTSIGTGTISGTTASFATSALKAGTHSITVGWAGNSSYLAVTSAAITQLVTQATPTITWATPAAVTSGTALSATQLNATASVPGTFAYQPPSGTVLAAGIQTVTVTFTPTDTTDYITTYASVNISASTTLTGTGSVGSIPVYVGTSALSNSVITQDTGAFGAFNGQINIGAPNAVANLNTYGSLFVEGGREYFRPYNSTDGHTIEYQWLG